MNDEAKQSIPTPPTMYQRGLDKAAEICLRRAKDSENLMADSEAYRSGAWFAATMCAEAIQGERTINPLGEPLVLDEFSELKGLVENLRASLPPLKEHQYQLVGLYLLAALRLGKSDETFHRCIDEFFTKQDSAALRVVK